MHRLVILSMSDERAGYPGGDSTYFFEGSNRCPITGKLVDSGNFKINCAMGETGAQTCRCSAGNATYICAANGLLTAERLIQYKGELCSILGYDKYRFITLEARHIECEYGATQQIIKKFTHKFAEELSR